MREDFRWDFLNSILFQTSTIHKDIHLQHTNIFIPTIQWLFQEYSSGFPSDLYLYNRRHH